MLVGIDEAGMGTLAGPMIMAVVGLSPGTILPGCRDSKKMTEAQRARIYWDILSQAEFYNFIIVENDLIDSRGISPVWLRSASLLAEWAHHLSPDSEIIIDGSRSIGLPWVTPQVKADAYFLAASAASVIAKFIQCTVMNMLALEYPWYGFNQHHGYPTKEHIKLLKYYGPCAVHRKSYGPVQKIMEMVER